MNKTVNDHIINEIKKIDALSLAEYTWQRDRINDFVSLSDPELLYNPVDYKHFSRIVFKTCISVIEIYKILYNALGTLPDGFDFFAENYSKRYLSKLRTEQHYGGRCSFTRSIITDSDKIIVFLSLQSINKELAPCFTETLKDIIIDAQKREAEFFDYFKKTDLSKISFIDVLDIIFVDKNY